MKIKILIPVFNDWLSVSKLVDEINDLSINSEFQISIIIVNDASKHDRKNNDKNLENINSIKILNMKENQGHARCIAVGLKYIYEKESIVGLRVKRSESLLFQVCYNIHKMITFTFTGKSIKFGNFTCLTKVVIEKMINEKATWNSFSGSLTKIEKDLISIPSIRGARYFGPSKMSFPNLLKHSLSIISVFKKTVLIRSSLFIVLYILLIKSNASLITAIPLILLLVMIYSVSNLALRENLDEFDKSLENIVKIDIIK